MEQFSRWIFVDPPSGRPARRAFGAYRMLDGASPPAPKCGLLTACFIECKAAALRFA